MSFTVSFFRWFCNIIDFRLVRARKPMAGSFFCALFLLGMGTVQGGNNEWTWMNGSSESNQYGTYGTLGSAAPDNTPGGRSGSVSWKDNEGNLWLFGGDRFNLAEGSSYFNDLWKYDPATNQWTWMKGSNVSDQYGTYGTQGSAALANTPGGRSGSLAWKDSTGNLWLFGGFGYGASGFKSSLNDLWKYDPATNQWTWMKGSTLTHQKGTYGTKGTADPANTPGTRYSSVSWKDNAGNLWLLGGFAYGTSSNGILNDLWKYDPTSNQWTWMNGSGTTNQAGTYGTQGIANPANTPGSRQYAVSWTDSSGNLWLFGGNGHGATVSYGVLNDLWKYDPTTNQWMWVKGSNAINQVGEYGTKGTAAPANTPGAREGSATWTDSSGSLWLFGGGGFDVLGLSGYLNDMWKYDPMTNQWTWAEGNNLMDMYGIYGTQGISDPANSPGGRDRSVSWTDNSGDRWLFGGWGFSESDSSNLNDLWKFSSGVPASASDWTLFD